ncbi:5,6-dimethylbenzimidazole synthase [Comamonas guangdongensis]|uniref:5,6-dimethylbenzimidazole synthase n=1 Tax=Comamonas guangdongensis TaxID=510515 RepID=A0ABV3ZXY3_9BURK
MTESKTNSIATIAATPFTEAERAAVYRAIYERRDMRHFAGGQVSDEVLLRLLRAAHHAPSVGFMQPWRFIRVKSAELRQAIHGLVEEERVRTAHALGEREEDFMKLKVQGVLDAAEVLVVTMPPGREAHIFGRRTLPEMDIASTACAIQNLWLAARAEGLGMGWVSIFDPLALAQLLRMPEGAHPLGVLCLGPVQAYYAEPMLQQEKWASRAPLEDMLMDDVWDDSRALAKGKPGA